MCLFNQRCAMAKIIVLALTELKIVADIENSVWFCDTQNVQYDGLSLVNVALLALTVMPVMLPSATLMVIEPSKWMRSV